MDIRLPELGVENGTIHVSSWLVEVGEHVEAGDQIVEVLVSGMTFDVNAPAAGVLAEIAAPVGSLVSAGHLMGWIES